MTKLNLNLGNLTVRAQVNTNGLEVGEVISTSKCITDLNVLEVQQTSWTNEKTKKTSNRLTAPITFITEEDMEYVRYIRTDAFITEAKATEEQWKANEADQAAQLSTKIVKLAQDIATQIGTTKQITDLFNSEILWQKQTFTADDGEIVQYITPNIKELN